jgi:hypothetical protein
MKSQVGFARRGIRYKSQVSKPLATGRVPSSKAECVAVPLIELKARRTRKASKPSKSAAKKRRRH